MTQTISAQELFTGDRWLSQVVVEMNNGKVESIKSEGYDHASAFALVVPALIDLQIYGAYGKLLSEFPEADTIQKIYDYCLAGGVAYFQPTLATQSVEVILKCIDAVKSYKDNGGKGCIGLHIEGPWIHPGKKGAHQSDLIHAPTMDEVQKILEYGKGYISMITLAPEMVDEKIVDYIASAGVIISAGHTDATYEQATKAFDSNITVATHLFNAMSPLQHRSPGVVGAIFNHKKVMSSLVADGYHVDFNAIKIAKKIMGERLFCITDAVTTTSSGPYKHELIGNKYESAGTLSGSALTQLQSIHNLVDEVGIELGEAIKMCSLYPAQVMHQEGISGKIEINKNADLLCLSADRRLLKIVTA